MGIGVEGTQVDSSVICDEPDSEETASTSALQETATPTRSEIKLQNLYSDLKESSDDDSGEEASDSDGENESIVDAQVLHDGEELEGNRLVDICILNQNIASQLCCTFCHSSVTLIEICRKGLGS